MSADTDLFAQAVGLHQAGRLPQAEELYRQVVKANPSHAAALCNLGAVLAQQGRPAEALRHYETAIRLQPDNPDTRFNLGNALRALGKFAEAAECYRAALRLKPAHLGSVFNLGLCWRAQGKWEDAQRCFEEAVRLNPEMPEARNHLGFCLHRLGRLEEAVAVYRGLITVRHDYIRGYHNLGLALSAAGRHAEARQVFEEALRVRPDYPEAHNGLGVTLEALGLPEEALAHYQRAVELRPDFADALNNLGIAYTEMGRHAEAIDCRRRALAVQPDRAHVHSNLLLTMSYSADVTPEQLLREHRAWAQQYADVYTAIWHGRIMDWNPRRRLKIGYVSADFRAHTVAAFLLPLLEHHDHEQFHVTGFANVRRPDEVTERMRALTDDWADISLLDDSAAAALVRNREIDILIDLSGHTAGNRLLVFAQKPAPIQVTHFGYPNTTGMAAMDYRVTDPHCDPPDAGGVYYSEQLLRLPNAAWCYRPPPDAPEVGPPPSERTGAVTFGCFNNPAKLTPPMIRAWARLLEAVPGSRLLVLAGRNGFGTAYLTERFAEAGAGPGRVEFVPRQPPAQYLELYHRADVLLDTYPYNGGVTSCDGLWMGVPMVTLAGRTYVSRQGVMLLTNVGLPDLIAQTPEEYVEKAASLARDPARLRELRAGLRDRLRNSPVMDAKRFVADLEAAYRRVWQAQTMPHKGGQA